MGYRKGGSSIVTVDYSPEIDAINTKLSDQDAQTTTLSHGLSVITTDQATPTEVKMFGRTLVNLLGKDGGFENLLWEYGTNVSNVVKDTTDYYHGQSSEKGTTVAVSGNRYFTYSFPNSYLKSGSYYLFSIYVKQSTLGDVQVTVRKDDGPWTIINSETINSMGTNQWIRFDVKFQMWNTGEDFKPLVEFFGSDAKDIWIDSASLYEIPQYTYDKINVDPAYTGDALADKFPYVDSVQHAMNPFIKNSGKNLIPPFTSGKWIFNSNAKVISDYQLELDADAGLEYSEVKIDCIGNTAYAISIKDISVDGILEVFTLDKNGNTLSGNSAISSKKYFSLVTESNANQLRVRIYNADGTTGTFTFTNLQVEIGSTATPFQPQNESYLYVAQDADKNPILLTSNNDGSVADEVYERDGQWYRLNRFERDMVLDGSLSWAFHLDGVGYKAVKYVNSIKTVSGVSGNAVKYDGKIIEMTNGSGNFSKNDQLSMDSQVSILLTVSDTDSGWGETYTPTVDEIKAYFYGWKMYDNTNTPDGTGVYDPGVSGATKGWCYLNTDGSWTGGTSMLPTSDSPAITNGTIDHYKLTYQLAQATEEAVEVEGSLDLIDGGNQIQVGEGVQVTVNDDGTQTITFIADNAKYNQTSAINNIKVTYNTNLKTVVDELVQRLEDDETDISVLKLQMIDVIARLQAGGL